MANKKSLEEHHRALIDQLAQAIEAQGVTPAGASALAEKHQNVIFVNTDGEVLVQSRGVVSHVNPIAPFGEVSGELAADAQVADKVGRADVRDREDLEKALKAETSQFQKARDKRLNPLLAKP